MGYIWYPGFSATSLSGIGETTMACLTILVDRPGIIFLESATPIRAVGVLPIPEESLVQRYDRQVSERADHERRARGVRWDNPAYNPGDGLPSSM